MAATLALGGQISQPMFVELRKEKSAITRKSATVALDYNNFAGASFSKVVKILIYLHLFGTANCKYRDLFIYLLYFESVNHMLGYKLSSFVQF